MIVLGGIAIASAPAAGCGGSVAGTERPGPGDYDGSTGYPDSGFPSEGPAFIDSGLRVDARANGEAGTFDSGFPSEGPAFIDSGLADAKEDAEAGPVDSGPDAFPQEGPPPLDAGHFPQETATP